MINSTQAEPVFHYHLVHRSSMGSGGQEAVFYRRVRRYSERHRILTEQDIRESLNLIGALMVAGLAPGDLKHTYNRAVVRLRRNKLWRRHYPQFLANLEAVLGITEGPESRNLFAKFRIVQQQRRMVLAQSLAFWRRPAEIDLHGADDLRSVMQAGGGALIWANPFAFQTIVGKRALWEAGFRAGQVSHYRHGFSNSLFGERVLNKNFVAAENRYLDERIVLTPGSEVITARRVLQRIKNGGLVIMTQVDHSGSVFVELPIGQSATIVFPTTVLGMAVRQNVPLFMMSTIQTEPLRRYTVQLVGPLNAIQNDSAKTSDRGLVYDRMAELAGVTRDLLLPVIREFPEQYMPNADYRYHKTFL